MAEENVVRSDFYVYVLFRPDTGQPFYVGKGCGYRLNKHCGPSRLGEDRKSRAIKKFLAEGFDIPRVKIAQNLTEIDALKHEQIIIQLLGRHPDGILLNATNGGEGQSGNKLSADHLRKLMDGRIGLKVTDRMRQAALKGLEAARKPECRAKMAATKRGKKLTPEHAAAIAAGNLGRVFTEETRRKISAAQKGISRPSNGPCPDHVKLAISLKNKGSKRSAESRALMSKIARERIRRKKEEANA